MGVFMEKETATANATPAMRTAKNRNKPWKDDPDFVPAQIWANVGHESRVPNEDGEIEEDFIALAKGIPVDTLEVFDNDRGSSRFAKKQAARNKLRENLIKAGMKLKPGESVIVNVLQVQLYRKAAEQPVVEEAENPFILDFLAD